MTFLSPQVNPSGRLPYTYPSQQAALVTYWDAPSQLCVDAKGGYVRCPVAFDFGTGLSYTTFAYSGKSDQKGGKKGRDVDILVCSRGRFSKSPNNPYTCVCGAAEVASSRWEVTEDDTFHVSLKVTNTVRHPFKHSNQTCFCPEQRQEKPFKKFYCLVKRSLQVSTASLTYKPLLPFWWFECLTPRPQGKVSGAHSVLLFMSQLSRSVVPEWRLVRGFQKVSLKAGESAMVVFDVSVKQHMS